MTNTYFFKHDAWGDEWQQEMSGAYDEEQFAEQVAEEYWSDDPTDPNRFEFKIEVKQGEFGTPKTYIVSAQADVTFYAREKKEWP